MKSPVFHSWNFIVYLFQSWLHTRITWGAFKISMPGSHLWIDSNGFLVGKGLSVFMCCVEENNGLQHPPHRPRCVKKKSKFVNGPGGNGTVWDLSGGQVEGLGGQRRFTHWAAG